ncbi:alternative oxidase, mitochondrial-like [Dendronephthya gigantea]|uniref:alternative oxidase, mitochondrial-like n=1 Tax=Dendronephthya gigantea TaxID=151771 RepID=UPI00106B4194|nr:alternative oxidase, mitochondrial-like [Dendronephthya gigantea]
MKSVSRSLSFFRQHGFRKASSRFITATGKRRWDLPHSTCHINIWPGHRSFSHIVRQQKHSSPAIARNKFQKYSSSSSNVSNQQSTPTHFKELTGKHPLPEVEEEKQIEREKAKDYILPHPIWTEEDTHSVLINHKEPNGKVDKLAYYAVQTLRVGFDIVSMYKIGQMTEDKWLTRIILLETVAGVPGMVGAMTRHFHSLRRMRRDHGWIHTLLEEAENERMHLMTALELKQPGLIFRGMVLLMQGVFVNMFFISYLLSPRFCHRFVGYLEEEAVKTYTYCLESIDSGALSVWENKPAPVIAKRYWRLKDDCTMRDVILAIRADEAHHRKVNHTLASMHLDQQNPFEPWERKL